MRYSTDVIGENAGIIWRYLDENGPSSLNQVKNNLEFTRTDLLLGLGWLMREEKITTENGSGRSIKFNIIE